MNLMSETVVTYVTNALWMTCVIAAATSFFSRALRRCPSSYRHALWVAALLLAVLVPLTSLRGSRNIQEPTPESVAAPSTVQSAEAGIPGTSSWALWRRMRHGGQPVPFGPLFVRLVALLYLGFVFYRAIRIGWACQSLRAMRRLSSERLTPPAMRALVERCHLLLGIKPVRIVLSLEGKGPATLGIRNPVLVLPEWLLAQASEDEISSALCHELAHIRRHDFLLNAIYEVFLLPIAFHPAAALIKARIDQTRELSCDEIAAECVSTRTQYAHSLLSIAQSMAADQRPATVGYALGLFDTNSLEDRIMNVLVKPSPIRKTRAQASAIATLVLLAVTCLGLSGFSIQVGQPTSTDADLQPFVGTWQAKFQSKTFLTIKLKKQDGKLAGTMSHADIQVNKDGELTSAEEQAGSDDPISDAKLTKGILRITTTDPDTQETTECDMKLTGADQAQLQLVVPPDVSATVPTPRPWKLERAKSGQ